MIDTLISFQQNHMQIADYSSTLIKRARMNVVVLQTRSGRRLKTECNHTKLALIICFESIIQRQVSHEIYMRLKFRCDSSVS